MTEIKNEEIVAYDGPDRVTHFTDHLLAKAALPTGKMFGCGFESFDAHMKGLKTGEVVVITGKKKNGKTLFAESWIRSMMKKDPAAKAVIFSYEMPAEDLLVKYMQDDTLPLYLPMSLETMDFDWLYKRCLESKLKFNCRIVLIDHLHFMVDMNTKQNMSLNIGAFMRRLKHDIAMGLHMSVILIAHQSSLREDQEASSDSMRDSSFIGQECDSVIVVSRKKNYTEDELTKISNNDFNKYQQIQTRNMIVQPLSDGEDNPYSAGFATVKISVNRRTGVFDWKKVFQKSGDFLEEI
jgi:replicative DNA helicase